MYMLHKKLTSLIPIVMGLLFLAMMSSNITANGLSAQNDLGHFYIHDEVLYFKGTLNGQTYSDYVALTGNSNNTGINSSFADGVTAIYATGGIYSFLDTRGQLFGLGEGVETYFGGSAGSNSAYVYLGGSSSAPISSVSLTNQGAIIKSGDGSMAVRGEHITDAGGQYDSTLSGSTNEDMVVLSNTNVARTSDGKLWIGNTKATMSNINAFNGENITSIGGSTSSADVDQMWALTDAGRLLYSTDGTTWVESETNVSQFFHNSSGKTVAIKNDNSYHMSTVSDPTTFAATSTGQMYSDTSNIMFDGDTLIIHNGNDLYQVDNSDAFSHLYTIAATYDSNGFDNFGIHTNGTEFGPDNLTKDRDAYDLAGFDISGYDQTGYDSNGRDSRGFNSSGDNSNGTRFDSNNLAFDGTAFDSISGTDWEGYDLAGFDSNRFDRAGLFEGCSIGADPNNYGCRFSTDASSALYQKTFDSQDYFDGRNYLGNTAGGLDQDGFRTVEPNIGYNEFTNSYFGEDNLTVSDGTYYNGYNWEGYDATGYDSSGFDQDGLDSLGFDVNGLWNNTSSYFDSTQCSGGTSVVQGGGTLHNGFDCFGYDSSGYDLSGFNDSGLDARGFRSTGLWGDSASYFHPTENTTIDNLEFDPITNLTWDNSEFGTDHLTWNDQVYGSDNRDWEGYDAAGFLLSGVHRNTTIYDDQGFDINGWNANGVFKDGMTVKNGELTKDFTMSHSVERDSFFKTLVKGSKISSAGDTLLGDLYIRNNTRDGFEVSIDSLEGGILQPSGVSALTPDGEVAIPYSIELTREGDLGVGIDETLTFSSSELSSASANRSSLDASGLIGVTILKVAGSGSVASSATDLQYSLVINIVDDSNVMEMAGTYTDTLTVTYKDH
jgi:hypothetical protein